MTEREVLKLALEALKYPLNQSHENFNVDMAELLAHRAITAIKEALAQPEHGWTPERIAGMARLKKAQDKRQEFPKRFDTHPTPPQRKPLTEEEIENIANSNLCIYSFARAIEAAHGIGE